MSNNQHLTLNIEEFSKEQRFHIQVMLDYKTKHCNYCADLNLVYSATVRKKLEESQYV